MDSLKRKRLDAAGWRVGTVAEFLNLSNAESALVEIRLSLASALKRKRQSRGVTQLALAKRLRSSQSRIAKMEAGYPAVSFELLMRALLVLGATRQDLAKAVHR